VKPLRRLSLAAVASAMAILAAGPVSQSDRMFAINAAEGGIAEVEMGKLAVVQGSTQAVRDFGQRMVDDHSKASDQLMSLAAESSINLPTDLSAKDKAEIERLRGLSGSDFDKAYMNLTIKDHQADLAAFEKEAGSGQNPELKNFASATLPMLKEHLGMAKRTSTAAGVTE
jgi:putative membrane protein